MDKTKILSRISKNISDFFFFIVKDATSVKPTFTHLFITSKFKGEKDVLLYKNFGLGDQLI